MTPWGADISRLARTVDPRRHAFRLVLLKRSLREQPQLAAFGLDADTVGQQEDYHGGSRRQKK